MGAIFMESTEVSDVRTVAEIQQLLSEKRAASVMVEYDAGAVSSLAFQLKIGDQLVPFRLPCRWESVQRILQKAGKKPRRGETIQTKARRIAWRQILRWVQAQLALIETGMVKAEEVFLPYAVVRTPDGPDRTMFQFITEKGMLALPPPAPKP